MELTYSTDERGGITLVELELTNPTTTRQQITITADLDGPVLPPRQNGYPVDGWDETGYSGTIDAGATLALGFACAAPPTDPPVTIDTSEPADAPDYTPGTMMRELGDPRPPSNSVDPLELSTDQTRHHPADVMTAPDDPTTSDQECASKAPTSKPIPPAIDAWFDAIADRVEAGDAVDTAQVCAVADRAMELHRQCQQ